MNKKNIQVFKNIILPFLVSFISVFILINLFSSNIVKNVQKKLVKDEVSRILANNNAPKDRLKELVELERYLYIDPLVLLKMIDNHDKNLILVDMRDKSSYKKSHVVGALNFTQQELLLNISKFKKKKVVIYGDTAYSLITKESALLLLEKSVDVRVMSIGWNEFRHFKNLWVPESSWDKVDINKYLVEND